MSLVVDIPNRQFPCYISNSDRSFELSFLLIFECFLKKFGRYHDPFKDDGYFIRPLENAEILKNTDKWGVA